MQKSQWKNRGLLLSGGALLVLAALFAAVYFLFLQKPVAGEKNITVEIVFADKSAKSVSIHTEAEYLRGALEEKDLIAGEESEYGLYIKAVDGVIADEALRQWWCITKGGTDVYTGVDETPIEDGDKFEITLTTGW